MELDSAQISPFLDDKSQEQIEIRLNLENPYQTSSLKDSTKAFEIFKLRLQEYKQEVVKLKNKPRELFLFLEKHKVSMVKKLRGGERSGSKDNIDPDNADFNSKMGSKLNF